MRPRQPAHVLSVSLAALLAIAALATSSAAERGEPTTVVPTAPSTVTTTETVPTTSTSGEAATPVVPSISEPTAAPATSPPAAPIAPASADTTIAAPATAPTTPIDPVAALLREKAGTIAPAVKGAERTDRQAIAAFYDKREGRPHWTTAAGFTPAATALMTEIRAADQWGLKAAAYDLPADVPHADDDARIAAELQIATMALIYARHARGGRLEPVTLSKMLDRRPAPYEPGSVLAGLADADAPDAYLRGLHPQHPQFERLRRLYVAALAAGPAPVAPAPKAADGAKRVRGAPLAETAGTPKKLHVNMEQWRWMPDDLGSYYVWVNIPEFTIRVVKDGKVTHTERVVVGKPDTPTPIFSDEMEFVIFHPEWGVPDSIKVKELWPSLRSSTAILAKQNLRVMHGNRVIDPGAVDWSSVDVRQFSFVQGSGSGNVLGVVKFRFPNKHDVYMHDTPTKGLFAQSVRAFSHGCMRVQNPVRLAELLLGEDKGWTPERIRAMAAPGAPQNQQVTLARKIPVHITYFTAAVDDDGKAHYRSDLYGHEERIHLGLEGKAHLIRQPREDLAAGPRTASPIGSFAEMKKGPVSREWMRQVFGGPNGFGGN